MGFRQVKAAVIKALKAGTYQYESRGDIATKNLLAIGAIAAEELAAIIARCNGTQHSSSPHHRDARIEVHVIKTDGWYVKFYFIDPDTMFISVHQQERLP